MESYVDQKDGIFKSVCSLDCPDQCGLLVHKKDGKIVKTVPRKNLFRAYTPQLCRLDLLKQSLNYAFENNLAITDDASALELSGFVVEIVEGSADNFKLTTREDLNMARLLIKE